MKKHFRFIAIIFFLFMLVGCSAQAVPAVKAPEAEITLTPMKSGLVGTLISTSGSTPTALGNTPVYLAPVYWDENRKEGAFALDTANGPSAISKEDGSFVIANIEPNEYVIIVGEIIGTNVIIPDEKGDARVVSLTADQVYDVGELRVALGN